MALTPRLARIVTLLLSRSQRSRRVSLDALGDAFGTDVASSDDVDAVMRALEDEGRVIEAPAGGDARQQLGAVLAAARALRVELGRAPKAAEVAARAGVDVALVQRALTFARVLQSGPVV